MKIYVASSWRNPQQIEVVAALRAAGHEVYDYRNPAPGEHGFSWSEVDPAWRDWTPAQHREGLNHPIARHAFGRDMAALVACDLCVLVLPCGRSAHLELGHAVGQGKRTIVFEFMPNEAELMYAMCGQIVTSFAELLQAVEVVSAEEAAAAAGCEF